MPGGRSVLRLSVWVFYAVFVLEILFMLPGPLYGAKCSPRALLKKTAICPRVNA
jgi:hypothetical protein